LTNEASKNLAFTFISNYAITILDELAKQPRSSINTTLKEKLSNTIWFNTSLLNKADELFKPVLVEAQAYAFEIDNTSTPYLYIDTFINEILIKIGSLPIDEIKYIAQQILQFQPGTNMISSTYDLPTSFDNIYYIPLTSTGKTNRDEQIEELCRVKDSVATQSASRGQGVSSISNLSAGTASGPLGLLANPSSGTASVISSSSKQKCPASLNNEIDNAKKNITRAMANILKIENVCKSQSGGYSRKSRKTKSRKLKKTKRTHRR
jgi:hypothetical protein